MDGQAEYRSLNELFRKGLSPQHALLAPIYADIQPYAPLSQIVGTIKKRLPILRARHVGMVLVLLDRENRAVCPGDWAHQIESALGEHCGSAGCGAARVVVKEASFENWLIADTSVFQRLPKRFYLNPNLIDSISENRADKVNAQSILKHAALGRAYDKVDDSIRIMRLTDPQLMARNSRSFRRLLRVVGNPMYRDQSINP